MEQIFGGGIIWTIFIGLIAGLLARAIKPGNDKLSLFWTIILGIGGALLAWYIGGLVGWYEPGEPAGFIASVVGAIVLLFLYGVLRRKKA
ncbi:GlsB/YeaQ/YmgE family stress response membrane protein [Pseudoxanthomonas suwonensis]|jgi:Predicted membrane protein|uniref:GlsB/YeaQ/YmgE family stress response membrane protein n=1 Tax=Pseudoxanthomonas suwonensis TaxID=314722 RepID=UPI0004B9922D|nr:GlsB/YeaQ/YmgE family stress response membrane protein [Pseudoxanthomonas suwonensis]